MEIIYIEYKINIVFIFTLHVIVELALFRGFGEAINV